MKTKTKGFLYAMIFLATLVCQIPVTATAVHAETTDCTVGDETSGSWVLVESCSGCASGWCDQCPGTRTCQSWVHCGAPVTEIQERYKYVVQFWGQAYGDCGSYCDCPTYGMIGCGSKSFASSKYEWKCNQNQQPIQKNPNLGPSWPLEQCYN